MSLDHSLLEMVRHHASGKVTARCPACAEAGGDRTGNHLVIFPDGKIYACAAHAGDGEHRKRIKALAGLPADFQPDSSPCRIADQHRRSIARNNSRKLRETVSKRIASAASRHRKELVERFAWEPADVWEDSPQRIDSDLVASCPRHFLVTLFPPDAVLWTGEVHQSGKPGHACRWRTCSDWLQAGNTIGPMTSPATWRPGTHSRSGDNVVSAPFTVLDFDGFDGIKPTTPEDLHAHFHASLALTRWLRDYLHWQLAAILHTGGKSLHSWFHNPGLEALASLRDITAPLGIDSGLIGRPEQPCRLPGHLHSETGKRSRIHWLQST